MSVVLRPQFLVSERNSGSELVPDLGAGIVIGRKLNRRAA